MTAVRLDAPPTYVWWRFTRHPRSVGRARALLREQARSWGIPDERAWTAALLLSELLTNACKHARVSPGREVHVLCIVAGGKLRIEVSDAGDGVPRLCGASAGDEAGRGLRLVAALADAWGFCPRPHGIGKTVWCELALADS
ncbi:ATP-binding protein [Streptomyces sp. NPDC026206]|uniref:ATP-binding protein n=1 Tax=Streptomyces sp. NPDC026206 TaxID=3157089 RepID=UPI0033CF9260